MAQVHASASKPDFALCAGEPSRKSNEGPSRKEVFPIMRAGAAPNKAERRTTPRWFEVVDHGPWYEDTGPANFK